MLPELFSGPRFQNQYYGPDKVCQPYKGAPSQGSQDFPIGSKCACCILMMVPLRFASIFAATAAADDEEDDDREGHRDDNKHHDDDDCDDYTDDDDDDDDDDDGDEDSATGLSIQKSFPKLQLGQERLASRSGKFFKATRVEQTQCVEEGYFKLIECHCQNMFI